MDEPTWERRSFSFATTLAITKPRRKVNITNIAVILIVGCVLIVASWRVSADIRLESEKRLKLEETITGALNKQNLAAKEFQDRLKAEAEDREFNRFLYGTSSPPPEVVQQRIEEDLRKLAESKEEQK